MWRILLLSLALSAGLGACVGFGYGDPSASVFVESRAEAGIKPTLTYAVAAKDARQAAEPEFAKMAAATRRMLSSAGFVVLPPEQPVELADVRVNATHSIGPRQPDSFTSYRPVYVETGIESSRTVERVNKRGEKVSTTTYTPRTAYAGLEEYTGYTHFQDQTLTLEAVNRRTASRLWSVKVEARMYPEVRNATVPLLLAAAQAQVGKTMSRAPVQVLWSDPTLAFIATGKPLSQSQP